MEVLEHEADLKATARAGYDPQHEPLSMRVVLVNQIADSAVAEIEFRNVAETVATPLPVPADLWVDESMAVKTDSLVDAQWCWEWWDPTWKPLAIAHVAATGARRITVTLPNIGARSVSYSRSLRVKIRYRHKAGGTNGLSWYNTIWLAAAHMGSHAPAPPWSGPSGTSRPPPSTRPAASSAWWQSGSRRTTRTTVTRVVTARPASPCRRSRRRAIAG